MKKLEIVCPSCGQGDLILARHKASGKAIVICDECDVVWLQGETIATGTGVGYRVFCEEEGGRPLWSELEF